MPHIDCFVESIRVKGGINTMKKITFILVLAIIICFVSLSIGGIAFAAVSEAECDEVFIATIEELLTAENSGDTIFSATKTILYDLNLEPFGYMYSFLANGENGFAIIINSNDIYECVEIYFDSANPYANAETDQFCIYVNTMTYWIYADEVYLDALTGAEIPEIVIESSRSKAYLSSGSAFVVVPEYIYYSYKTDTKYPLVNRHPFNSASTTTSSCVPTAGANIVQFYDRYCVNLIPNYVPGITYGSVYRYKMPSTETDEVIIQLASDMGVTDEGATIQMFVDGMTKYCNDRSYNITFTTCMSNNQFSYANAKSQMQSGKPIALFVDPYSIDTITEYDGYDLIEYRAFTVPHAMAVFGYRDITYTLTNGQIRSDSYLQTATGNAFVPQGYCKLNSDTTIDQALAIYIA